MLAYLRHTLAGEFIMIKPTKRQNHTCIILFNSFVHQLLLWTPMTRGGYGYGYGYGMAMLW
jgi:hypothetical protein